MYDNESEIEYLFATHMFSIKQQIKALKDTNCYLFDFKGCVWYKGEKVADDFNSFIIQKRKENEPKIRERQAIKQATEDYITKQRKSHVFGKLRLEQIAKKVCEVAGIEERRLTEIVNVLLENNVVALPFGFDAKIYEQDDTSEGEFCRPLAFVLLPDCKMGIIHDRGQEISGNGIILDCDYGCVEFLNEDDLNITFFLDYQEMQDVAASIK